MNILKRRTFFTSILGAAAVAAFNGTKVSPSRVFAQTGSNAQFKGKLLKSMYWGMFPEGLSVSDKFRIAKRIGLDGVEVPSSDDSGFVNEVKQAARENSIIVQSVMCQTHWKYPLSSSDPSIISTGIKGMETSLRNAKEYGADTVLLVPAVVNSETSYKDAYERSQKHIRELLPLARELKVIISVENVWNKFLLSPLEFARYIDEFDNSFLKAYFDVGNIVLYGYPQDWIRILGKRIVKVHIKGFDEKRKEFVNLGDGTIDWLEVRKALSDIGYNGFINAELKDGDETYLLDVSRRMDKIINGEKI